jgi:hypothetical protein
MSFFFINFPYSNTDVSVFWGVAPCCFVESDDFIDLMMEVLNTFEVSVNFYDSTYRNILEENISTLVAKRTQSLHIINSSLLFSSCRTALKYFAYIKQQAYSK